jgi:hypothetical protein
MLQRQEQSATLARHEQVTVRAAHDPIADNAFHGVRIRIGGYRRAQM